MGRSRHKTESGRPGDGEVTRLMDFGAFVPIMPGVEGLIHVSEMSWTRRVQRASEVLKLGEHVEAVVLKVDAAAARSAGLKQGLGNPWDTVKDRFPNGNSIEGKVTRARLNFSGISWKLKKASMASSTFQSSRVKSTFRIPLNS